MNLEEARRTLGVDIGATPEELKSAWRSAIKVSHPDMHPNIPDATERFARVQDAYHLLSSEGGGTATRPMEQAPTNGPEIGPQPPFTPAQLAALGVLGLRPGATYEQIERTYAHLGFVSDGGTTLTAYLLLMGSRATYNESSWRHASSKPAQTPRPMWWLRASIAAVTIVTASILQFIDITQQHDIARWRAASTCAAGVSDGCITRVPATVTGIHYGYGCGKRSGGTCDPDVVQLTTARGQVLMANIGCFDGIQVGTRVTASVWQGALTSYVFDSTEANVFGSGQSHVVTNTCDTANAPTHVAGQWPMHLTAIVTAVAGLLLAIGVNPRWRLTRLPLPSGPFPRRS